MTTKKTKETKRLSAGDVAMHSSETSGNTGAFRLTKLLLVLTVACSFFIGCSRSKPSTEDISSTSQSIQLRHAFMIVDGDKWIYSFQSHGRQCVIVGEDVAFVGQDDDHIVVNQDLTETEKVHGKKLGSYTLLNVPTDGRYPVLIVDTSGFTECSIAVPEKFNANEFLDEVLNFQNENNAEENAQILIDRGDT